MDKIHHCLDDHGCALAREVKLDGETIATIRPLRPLDRDLLQRYLGPVSFEEGRPVYREMQPEALRLARIVLSLGGELDGRSHRSDTEGWRYDGPVTLDSVNQLPLEALETLDAAVRRFEDDYAQRREAVRKNLPPLSAFSFFTATRQES
ncbi:MAG: hypothetical protein K8R90_09390 [Candidatus Cloacimonetes bacterium]|nr:hypothetical protein [Candidatus Cloacimonadota bacterium]